MPALGSLADGRHHFSVRAAAMGLLIGILINLANTYYGLQTGTGMQMPMVSALLGYLMFSFSSRITTSPLSVSENVLITSVATAAGCMPITASFTGFIPAMEFVLSAPDGGKQFTIWQLLLWSVGLCFFGITFAALWRQRLVERGRLPWPGPKAVSQMLLTIHSSTQTTGHSNVSQNADGGSGELEHSLAAAVVERPKPDWQMGLLATSSILSGLWSIFMHFLPILRAVPVFGRPAAHDWHWALDLSPGFLGQGVILGMSAPVHMFIGTIVGWAILGPFAKRQGWAPGPIDNWETGPRGWIIWVSLSGLMADAVVNLAWFTVHPIWTYYRAIVMSRAQTGRPSTEITAVSEDDEHDDLPQESVTTETPLLHSPITRKWTSRPDSSPSITAMLGSGFLVSALVCVIAVHTIFWSLFPWYFVILAIILALPMSIVSIRALGEADWNPNISLFSQLVFATLVPHSNPNALVANLLSAALATAGENQVGDIAYDFKIGQLTSASPNAQILGHMIGSVFGSLLSCIVYRLYTLNYSIPGPIFGVPKAYVAINLARLLLGEGLPEGAVPFIIAFGSFFLVSSTVRIFLQGSKWQALVPNGTSFAIGMYNAPSFTLSRLLGALFYTFYARGDKSRRNSSILLATGLILGESLGSVVNLGLATVKL